MYQYWLKVICLIRPNAKWGHYLCKPFHGLHKVHANRLYKTVVNKCFIPVGRNKHGQGISCIWTTADLQQEVMTFISYVCSILPDVW